VYFCRRRRDRIDQLLPLMEVCSPLSGRRGVSLPFTDSCPPLDEALPDTTELYEEAMHYGRSQGWKYLETRGGFRHWHGAKPSLSFFAHHLDLARGEALLFENLKDSARRNIRKAERSGLRVERAVGPDAIKSFYRLHCETRRRHGLPPQPFRFFESISRHVLTAGKGWVFSVTLGDQPIAAGVFFHHGRRAIYKFGASNAAFQHLRPSNLMMWEAIKHYAAAGFASLDFGRTSQADKGLRRFKLGLGAAETQLDYCRFDFATDAFVTCPDRSHGWFNSVFSRLPLPILRWAGATLYPHLS
jgi:hypothetical protein